MKQPTVKPIPVARVVSENGQYQVVRHDGAVLVQFPRYEDAKTFAVAYVTGYSEKRAA